MRGRKRNRERKRGDRCEGTRGHHGANNHTVQPQRKRDGATCGGGERNGEGGGERD